MINNVNTGYSDKEESLINNISTENANNSGIPVPPPMPMMRGKKTTESSRNPLKETIEFVNPNTPELGLNTSTLNNEKQKIVSREGLLLSHPRQKYWREKKDVKITALKIKYSSKIEKLESQISQQTQKIQKLTTQLKKKENTIILKEGETKSLLTESYTQKKTLTKKQMKLSAKDKKLSELGTENIVHKAKVQAQTPHKNKMQNLPPKHQSKLRIKKHKFCKKTGAKYTYVYYPKPKKVTNIESTKSNNNFLSSLKEKLYKYIIFISDIFRTLQCNKPTKIKLLEVNYSNDSNPSNLYRTQNMKTDNSFMTRLEKRTKNINIIIR